MTDGLQSGDHAQPAKVDVHSSRGMERGLLQALLHMEQILCAVEDGIMGVDRQGKSTYVNPAAAFILGYTVEDLLGVDIHERVHYLRTDGSHYLAQECPIRDTLENGTTFVVNDEIFCRKNGAVIPVEYTSTPIVDAGRVIGAVVTFRDITMRKAADAKLRRYMDLLDRSQRFSHLGSWERDMLTGHGYWSDETYRIFGLEPKSGIPLTRFFRCVHPEDIVRVELALRGAERGELYDLQYRIIRPDGEERVVWSQGEPVWANGRVVQSFGIIQDITEQERVKRRLRDSEELLRRSDQLSVVGQLAAALAHEIRNPLTALKGFTQLLAETTSDRERRYVEIMKGELGRIEGITNEMLFMSKPHAATQRPVDLALLLREASELLSGEALLNRVMILTDGSSVPPVLGDEAQLKQVLINLMKNAIEAMPHGGILRLQTWREEHCVRVAIQDEGHGMSPEAIARLGEPFFTTKTAGTGLGMMVSQRILTDHGGSLKIESELGKGTRVDLAIPCAVA